jgi:ABC-type hemin transport system substrate-binding protein
VIVYNQDPLVVAGRGSWGEELLRAAGGENAVLNPNRYPLLSMDQLMSFVPQVLVDLTSPARPLAEAWAEHRSIPAIANGRVLRFDGPLLRRIGPRVVEAAGALARGLHPGLSR